MFEAFRCAPLAARAARASPLAASETPAALDAAAAPAAKRRRKQAAATPGGAAATVTVTVMAPSPASASGAAPTTSHQGLASEIMGDQPLRLVIVGHNPSDHAWNSGHFYSNPSNWMWRILRDTGIAPAAAISGAADDARMPAVAGVGFTDVGSGTPGTDSSRFSSHHFKRWRPGFFERLTAHMRRASDSIGCTCGRCGAPAIAAFSGKRQFAELFPEAAGSGGSGGRGSKEAEAAAAAAAAAAAVRPPDPPKASAAAAAMVAAGSAVQPPDGTEQQRQQQQQASSRIPGDQASQPGLPVLQARRPGGIVTGRQWVLPVGWPLPLTTEVWVMTSTSGAAPMTRQQRYAPWQSLAERLSQEPWPRQCVLQCSC